MLENDTRSGNVTLKAYIAEEQTTKSEYTLVGETYQFAWVTNDKFIVQTFDGSSTYSENVFTTSTGGRPSVLSTGTVSPGYTLQDYAFYPNDGTGTTDYTNNFTCKKVAINPIAPGASISEEKATVKLAGTITEDKAHPMAHIPMIGKKDGSGDYRFTPCTGVLKVTIKNFPTTATQVRLDVRAGSYNLQGEFVFDTDFEIKSSYAKTGYSLKYLNVTASASEEDRSFYFPIPTGTISASSIELSVKDGNDVWSQGLIGKSVTIQKGVVTELPPVTYQSGGTVSIVGTMAVPKAKIRIGGSSTQFIVFKITDDATVPTEDLNNTSFGGKLSYSQTWTISKNATYFPGFATSGVKYFHYQVYNSNNTKYGEAHYVTFPYLASGDYGVALSSCTSAEPEINITAKGSFLEEVRAIITNLSEADAYAKLDASRTVFDDDVLVVSTKSNNNAIPRPTGLKSGKSRIYIRGYNTYGTCFDQSYDFYFQIEYCGGGCPDLTRRELKIAAFDKSHFVGTLCSLNDELSMDYVTEIYDLDEDPKQLRNLRNKSYDKNAVDALLRHIEQRRAAIKNSL